MGTRNELLTRMDDGRPVLPGCSTLPPMDDDPATATRPKEARKAKKKAKRNAGNRFAILNEFVDCSMPGLTRSELATWFVLYRDTKDGIARTSQSDIARRAGLSVRAVKSAVRRLENRGLLIVAFTGGLNRGPSRYRVRPAPDD